MSISSEITRLQTAKSDLKTAIESKGVTVPSSTTLDGYATLVGQISGGGGSTVTMANFPTLRLGYSYCTTIPYGVNFTGVTDFSYMFKKSDVTTILQGDIDTSSGTDFTDMFDDCESLTSIAGIDTSSGVIFDGMFSSCNCLETLPSLDTSSGTSFYATFAYMNGLVTMPEYDLSSATDITNIINECRALINLGGFKDLGKAYLTSRSANYSNYTLNLQGKSSSPNNNISYASLMNVINKLYDIATKGCNAQKLILGSTLMAKLTAEEIAIANNKGWSVS